MCVCAGSLLQLCARGDRWVGERRGKGEGGGNSSDRREASQGPSNCVQTRARLPVRLPACTTRVERAPSANCQRAKARHGTRTPWGCQRARPAHGNGSHGHGMQVGTPERTAQRTQERANTREGERKRGRTQEREDGDGMASRLGT
eukprot:6771515-Prymnesium_polylepis.2